MGRAGHHRGPSHRPAGHHRGPRHSAAVDLRKRRTEVLADERSDECCRTTFRIQIDRPAASAAQGQPNPSPVPFRSLTVVGIAGDVRGGPILPILSFQGVYLPADVQTPGTELLLRVRGDLERARLSVIDRLTAVDPALDHEVQT